MHESTDGWTDDKWKAVGLSDAWMDGWMDGQTNGQSDGWMMKQMNEWMSK